MEQRGNRLLTIYGFLIPIFFLVSLLFPKFRDPKGLDFALYWQAGHMVLSGQDVYDSSSWVTEREIHQTALHSEPTFQYPLHFAVLFVPLGALPIEVAYRGWIFFAELSILISVSILLSFAPNRSAYLELFVVAGIFLFRASYVVIFSGQILSLMLLANVLAIYLLHKKQLFIAGLMLSLLTVKPSMGFPILLLSGLWFLFTKRWRVIWGIILGCLALYSLGAIVNPMWALQYVNIGNYSFYKYYGIQSTLWGLTGCVFNQPWDIWISAGSVVAVLLFSVYIFWRYRSKDDPFLFFAIALPIALLIAPYSWAYDHIFLIIPFLFTVIILADRWGIGAGAGFLFGIDLFAAGLVTVAYKLGYDVWSVLIPIVVLFILVLFISRQTCLLKNEVKIFPKF